MIAKDTQILEDLLVIYTDINGLLQLWEHIFEPLAYKPQVFYRYVFTSKPMNGVYLD